MDIFSHHKMNKTPEGYEITLYLNYSNEFSNELGKLSEKRKESIEEEATHYIKAKFTNINVKLVKIMGGAILVSTLAFAPIKTNTAEAAENTNNTVQQNSVTSSYTVKSGDNLWNLAVRFNTTVNDLKAINKLNTDILQIGQTLTIPTATTTTNQLQNEQLSTTYTVVSGDTLSGIAVKYGTTVNAIKTANNLTNDFLRVGQALTVPGGEVSASPYEKPTQERATTYTVISGDTLSGIAVKYGTTVNAIKTANNLTNDFLRVGQTLTVPGGEVSASPYEKPTQERATTYTVISGDTLSGIAVKYGTTVNAIKTANNLTSDFLRVGQALTIPGGEVSASPYEKPTQERATTYTVISGDTLSGIAVKYGTTVNAIKTANNLTSDFLRVGQALTIPSTNTNGVASTPSTDDRAAESESAINQEELQWLANMIYSEARGESLDGQIAVGAVIMNRVNSDLFPNTVKEVIFEKSHGHYQFTPAGTGSIHQAKPNSTNMEAAMRAINGEDPTNGSLFFYNPDKTNDQWVRSRTVSTTIGNHVFAF
ncbi:LysM peptidoglycan-binding domain-containing protein [Evansella sp. AB-P1]|uniref:LysM peptidoglycan-binding domain-containing protein n=1 Tax=Evansella sp. AB-P1 TaxID=3037653 RepID=UPI00241C3387|nr:LysM peptidoglycan-binding domain-containing protein [Evansella sp. AB-P1]MDG5788446.1 LysM peptidoglycan-binding domain-containing protein [Evansella sp. AB-P1]